MTIASCSGKLDAVCTYFLLWRIRCASCSFLASEIPYCAPASAAKKSAKVTGNETSAAILRRSPIDRTQFLSFRSEFSTHPNQVSGRRRQSLVLTAPGRNGCQNGAGSATRTSSASSTPHRPPRTNWTYMRKPARHSPTGSYTVAAESSPASNHAALNDLSITHPENFSC